jgi:ABC-2 type transport system permease protein
MLAYLRFEVRRLVRIRGLLVFSTVIPVAIYVAFTAADSAAMSELSRGIPVSAVAMVMVTGFGALIGVLSHSSGVAYERVDGWLRQLRTTALPPLGVVAAKGIASTMTVLPPVLGVGATAMLLHGLRLPPGRWLLAVAALWLAAVPFALLGLGLGYLLSREVVGPATTVVWLVLAIAGGLMVSVDTFPAWLRPISYALPSYRYAELGWQAVGGSGSPVAPVAILAAWTVAFGGFAAWAYRRSSAIR